MTTTNSEMPVSRSASPDANSSRSASPESELPQPVQEFFQAVSHDGFPASKSAKIQPWKARWAGVQHPSDDGKLIVACPKICTYGSSNLGGL
ncbi:hypothetical protein DL98DRAFT_589826 [Cadophora sp. DSE1049]|nr:hypothetical protein DL98DRAFT_589826 [Cadophora sp. DSE1049]